MNYQMSRFQYCNGLGNTKEDDATGCRQAFLESQFPKVSIKGYEHAILSHGTGQYAGIHHSPVIFVHPDNIVPRIS
jgi:hypothetical protein